MEITMLEVTEEELKSIIAKREQKIQEEKIAELTKQLQNTIKEIKSLGGDVRVQKEKRYGRVLGDSLYKITCDGRMVKFHC